MSDPSPNSRLYDLAVKYASDKLYWHSYIPMYEQLFGEQHNWIPAVSTTCGTGEPYAENFNVCSRCRNVDYAPVIPPCVPMNVRRVLEIGIGHESLMQPLLPSGVKYVHGSSLRMWEEYWPNAQIYGCDIREDVLVNEGRIHSRVCNQSVWSPHGLMGLVEWAGGPLDVVIDDGSHDYADQNWTAHHLLEDVREGGVYVIEDVWPDKGAQLALEFGGMLWRGDKGRDDNLVVIYR